MPKHIRSVNWKGFRLIQAKDKLRRNEHRPLGCHTQRGNAWILQDKLSYNNSLETFSTKVFKATMIKFFALSFQCDKNYSKLMEWLT